MIQKLKRKHFVKYLVIALCYFAIAIGMVICCWDNLSVIFKEAVNIEDLKPEDIKAGVKVCGSVYYAEDYYSYTEETSKYNKDGRTVEKEFFIPVGEEEYMGYQCSGSNMKKLNSDMELYWSYLDGGYVSKDDFKEVKISGTIQEITGESRRHFDSYINDPEIDAETKNLIYPYKICEGYIGNFDTMECIVFAVGFGLFILLGGANLLIGIFGNNTKSVDEYCKKSANSITANDKVEKFYESEPAVAGFRIDNELFMAVEKGSAYLAETNDILWVYQGTVNRKFKFIAARSEAIFVKKCDGTELRIRMKNRAMINDALKYISEKMPYIIIGYYVEVNASYRLKRQEIIDLVNERKREYFEENVND